MRPTLGWNSAYLYTWQFALFCLLVLLAIVWLGRWLWRRREAQRRVTRYEFGERGRVHRKPPRRPHELCTGFTCFNPEAGHCPRLTAKWLPR